MANSDVLTKSQYQFLTGRIIKLERRVTKIERRLDAAQLARIRWKPHRPSVSEYVKRLRRSTGMTQEQFAAFLEKSYVTINRWENGHNSPSRAELRRIEEQIDRFVKSRTTATHLNLSAKIRRLVMKRERERED